MFVFDIFEVLDLFRSVFLRFVEQVLLVFFPNGLEGLQVEGVDALEDLVHFLYFEEEQPVQKVVGLCEKKGTFLCRSVWSELVRRIIF